MEEHDETRQNNDLDNYNCLKEKILMGKKFIIIYLNLKYL
jgi:hypothetical protein